MKNHLSRIWSKGGSLLRRFGRDMGGNVAVTTGLVAVPLFAVAGLSIDYAHQTNVRTFMQAEADAAALAAAIGGPTTDDQGRVTLAKTNTMSRYTDDGVKNVTFTGKWLSATDFSVEGKADVPITLVAALPGVSQKMNVNITAVARYSEPVYEYNPPTLAELDPDAADYNRMFVYCFDPKTSKRTQEVAVADNGGTKYTYTMPLCKTNETLSFHLYNVRNMRTTPSKWDKGSATRYNYYTDTTINSDGSEAYHLGYSLLETILCDTQAQCKPVKSGGIIKEGTNRTPAKATVGCSTGKYMYYGWEDRPPEQGGSDKDYNDIRIVLGCPTIKASGKNSVVLIK